MSQSLARIYVHLVFSTKHRAPFLNDRIREPLHAYMGAVLKRLGCGPLLINSVADHIHLLFDLGRKSGISEVVEEIKKASTKWLKAEDPDLTMFAWQAGYAAFSVSESNVKAVTSYIADQQTHHHKRSFQDELRLILDRHGVHFDERYLWD